MPWTKSTQIEFSYEGILSLFELGLEKAECIILYSQSSQHQQRQKDEQYETRKSIIIALRKRLPINPKNKIFRT